MILTILLFALTISVSQAEQPVPVTPPILCGKMPYEIFRCLGRPKLLKKDIALACSKSTSLSQCELFTCTFNNSGWMEGDKVDKTQMAAYYDQVAKDQPAWEPAVQHVKSACLANGTTLPAQGAYLNCPPNDIWLCIMSGFIKHATASQWSTESSCEYPRKFAEACPLCPSECFMPFVPFGSCNACVLLPRSQ